MQGLVGGPGVDTQSVIFVFIIIIFLIVRHCDLPDNEVALLCLRRC